MRLIDADMFHEALISRTQAIDTLRKMQTYKLFAGDDMLLINQAEAQTELMMLPSAQPEPCEDAVSREAVLSMIDTYMNKSVELHYLPTSDGIKKLISILPSAQPEIIHCKDCVYQTESWSGIKYCEAHGDHIGKDYDYCSNARRRGEQE